MQRKCTFCPGIMKEKKGKDPIDGLPHFYWECQRCGYQCLDMRQLHEAVELERKVRKYHVKLSKWGLSLGVRIPKAIAKKYKLRESEEVVFIPEERAIKILPLPKSKR